MISEEFCLIWSIEHDAWWAPNESGYRNDREDAGMYRYNRAKKIVADVNKFLNADESPNEALVPLE